MNTTHPGGPHILPFARPPAYDVPVSTMPVTRLPAAEQPTSVSFTRSTRSALEKRLTTALADLARIEYRCYDHTIQIKVLQLRLAETPRTDRTRHLLIKSELERAGDKGTKLGSLLIHANAKIKKIRGELRS